MFVAAHPSVASGFNILLLCVTFHFSLDIIFLPISRVVLCLLLFASPVPGADYHPAWTCGQPGVSSCSESSHCHMRNRSWRAATSSSSVYTGTCTFAPQSFTQMTDMTVWMKSKSAAPTAAPGPHWRWCGGGAGAGNPSSHPPPPPLYSAGQCGVSTI